MDTRPINHHANHAAECITNMHTNGISFDGCLKAEGQIHRFSSDSKKNKKDEWYIAYSGISQKGNEYLICIYGSWSSSSTLEGKYIFKSWRHDHFLDEEERKELQKAIQQKGK